jgi:oxygen-independent coproporphyrinogen III oxidase
VAGLYLHIPFCRKLCYYCDFHFTVSFKNKARLVKALVAELKERAAELSGEKAETLYFGGGTPSVLSLEELTELFETIYTYYTIADEAEVTFEANPDDLDNNYLLNLRQYTPVNRLSIGIQSFSDNDLVFLNRRHTALEAKKAIERAKECGFSNLNVDLIYGIPGMSAETWVNNLETFAQLDVPHLSAYHLTIEPKTVFGYYKKKGKLAPIGEDLSLKQFELLTDFMQQKGYDHYEISNFALPGMYSKHNLGYWTGKTYLGFGPSAHSFSGRKRRWNIANNTTYCGLLENQRNDYFDEEEIDTDKAYNEYILTSLRTMWGINLKYIRETFGPSYLETCLQGCQPFIDQGNLLKHEEQLTLSRKGMFIADYIIAALMAIK